MKKITIKQYNLDLEMISIQKFQEMLKNHNLLPSRRILLQKIDEYFSWFENNGISNVSQLKKNLSTPKRLALLSEKSGISVDYLVILKREMSSLVQKPVLVGSFTGIDEAFINRLNAADIMNSKEYWERNQTATDELFCLCDLVRINGVGPVAARMFYETGYQSVEDVAAGDAALMLKKISDCNATQQFYKSKLGIKDMQFCIDFAKLLS